MSRDLKDFKSREPNYFPHFPFSCGAGTKTPYPTSYSYAITSNCKLPAGFAHALAFACSEKGSTSAGWNLKALPESCWKFTCTWLMCCLSWTEPSLTGYHSSRLQVLGRTAKLDSATNFYVFTEYNTMCPPASKETVVNLSGKLLDDAVYSAL